MTICIEATLRGVNELPGELYGSCRRRMAVTSCGSVKGFNIVYTEVKTEFVMCEAGLFFSLNKSSQYATFYYLRYCTLRYGQDF